VNTLAVEGELRPVNPATLEPVGAVPVTHDVGAVVAESVAAQEEWGRSSFDERRRVLVRAARVLLARIDEVADTITAETGKPVAEAYTHDVMAGIEQLAWIARNAERSLAPERIGYGVPYLAHKRAHTVYEPLGVIAVIAPSNVPLAVPLAQSASALAAGNGVVVKPSELTPHSGAWIADIYAEAGAPPGLVGVVQGTGETGAELVAAPGVAKIVFTGSAAIGRAIAAAAGGLLRPVTLELGGKDPMLVLRDADLRRAVEGAAWGSFANCGQLCVAIERIYVARELHAPFVDALAARSRELRIGRGDDPDTDVGPLITESRRARVEDLVAESLERGAEAVTGARRPDVSLPGWFYEPTVLVGGDPDSRIEQEEIFGPVVTVQPFDDEDEAVHLANATSFGLGASVWSRDVSRARALAARIEAGMVWTNDLGHSFGAGPAPWGGRKQSGFGVTHSRHALRDLSNLKLVDRDRGRVRVPWWYPYGPHAVDGLKGVLGILHGEARLRAAWTHRRGLAHLAKRYLSG
jgi:succinate-semialdehyde dehydrogenase/glutarate-semialdehyde dehydrogenase